MKYSRKVKRLSLLFLFLLLFVSSTASASMAQQDATVSEVNDEDGSAAQAQETLSSLFGRNTRIPDVPVTNGTLALPSFDSSNMTIDKNLVEPPEN